MPLIGQALALRHLNPVAPVPGDHPGVPGVTGPNGGSLRPLTQSRDYVWQALENDLVGDAHVQQLLREQPRHLQGISSRAEEDLVVDSTNVTTSVQSRLRVVREAEVQAERDAAIKKHAGFRRPMSKARTTNVHMQGGESDYDNRTLTAADLMLSKQELSERDNWGQLLFGDKDKAARNFVQRQLQSGGGEVAPGRIVVKRLPRGISLVHEGPASLEMRVVVLSPSRARVISNTDFRRDIFLPSLFGEYQLLVGARASDHHFHVYEKGSVLLDVPRTR